MLTVILNLAMSVTHIETCRSYVQIAFVLAPRQQH